MDTKLFEKATIITTPHDRRRYPYLLRFMSYYGSYNFPANILILDSCPGEIESDMLKELLTNSKIDHKKYPHAIPFEVKLVKGLNEVQTPYCVIVPEDDFISPYAIEECVCFLETNSEYSTAHGHYVSFGNYPIGRHSDRYFTWGPIKSYITPSISGNDSISRIFEHLTKYTPTFSAVHRTTQLISNWRTTIKYASRYEQVYSPFYEMMPSCLSMVQGKCKRLDIFYGAREHIVGSAGSTFQQWNDIIFRKDFCDKYQEFLKCLTDDAKVRGNLECQLLEEKLGRAFSIFLKDSFNAESVGLAKKGISGKKFKGKLKGLLYQWKLFAGIKYLHIAFSRIVFSLGVLWRIGIQRENGIQLMWWLNIYKQYKDMKRIKEVVIKQ